MLPLSVTRDAETFASSGLDSPLYLCTSRREVTGTIEAPGPGIVRVPRIWNKEPQYSIMSCWWVDRVIRSDLSTLGSTLCHPRRPTRRGAQGKLVIPSRDNSGRPMDCLVR